MVSLKWGDVLSTLLPGVVVLLALAPHIQWLNARVNDANSVTAALTLLTLAALSGGILEAITRISWERWLCLQCNSKANVLTKLDSSNLELYERGVQSSYKYVTFYANLAWAVAIFLVSQIIINPGSLWVALLLLVIGVLLRASYLQWTYFVNYQDKVFGQKGSVDAGQRPAPGNERTPEPRRDNPASSTEGL